MVCNDHFNNFYFISVNEKLFRQSFEQHQDEALARYRLSRTSRVPTSCCSYSRCLSLFLFFLLSNLHTSLNTTSVEIDYCLLSYLPAQNPCLPLRSFCSILCVDLPFMLYMWTCGSFAQLALLFCTYSGLFHSAFLERLTRLHQHLSWSHIKTKIRGRTNEGNNFDLFRRALDFRYRHSFDSDDPYDFAPLVLHRREKKLRPRKSILALRIGSAWMP